MASKAQLIEIILRELRNSQTAKWKPTSTGSAGPQNFPLSLPVGDGRHLSANEGLIQAVSSYAKLCLDNYPSLRPRFRIEEFTKLVRQAFGRILTKIDLDQKNDGLIEVVAGDVDALLNEWIDQHLAANHLTLGCHLLKGQDAYPIRIGPVIFETQGQWCQRMLDLQKLTPVTARRLQTNWNGKSTRKRKPSNDTHKEDAVLRAIGNCPIVCTIETNGLSGKFTQEKGVLAARLAMTAIALMWHHPSEGLRWMNLLFDRRVPIRYTAIFSENGHFGSNSEVIQMSEGRWTDAELIADLRSYQWLFDTIGDAVFTYVQPTRHSARPTIMNALFLSLWWYHEACREPLDQIATTKFAASMDALVVGQDSGKIIDFIGARLGYQAGDPLMKDGRTTKETIQKIYSASRSRLIHGSSVDYSHDWSQVRGTAEAIGRLCIIAAADWLSQNTSGDDLAALSQP